MAFQGRNDTIDTPFSGGTASEDYRATRDDRGRFIGCGNRRGRPRKVKLPPANSLSAALALELQKDITIRMDGKQKTVPVFEAIAAKLIHAMMSGSSRESLVTLRHIQKLGVIDIMSDVQDYKDCLNDENSAPAWTAELEAKYRIIAGEYGDFTDDDSVDDEGRQEDHRDEGNLYPGWDAPDG